MSVDLDGTRMSGLSTPVGVDDVALIDVTGAQLSQSGFTGGSVSISNSGFANPLSGNEVVDLNGSFFGPSADEVGGVVSVDDTSAGSFRLRGTFVAD